MKMEYLCNLIEKPVSGEWGDDGDKIPVIRSTNFTMDGILDLADVKFRDIDDSKIAKKKLQRGDIIIEKSGGSLDQPVGRVVFFDEEGDFLFSNFTSALRPKTEKVFPKYLNYLLLSAYRGNITSYFQNRTTGIINLQLTRYIDELQIPLPPLPTQQKIAAVLDKADAIRKRSQQILAKYDQLAQSVFLEMFGDPVKNEKGWEVNNFGKLIIDVKNGITRRPKSLEDERNGHKVLKLKHIRSNYIEYQCDNKIILDKHEQLKYSVELNDLLFIRVNGNPDYVGRCALHDNKFEKVYFNDHIMRVRYNLDHYNGLFLCRYLNSIFGQYEISKRIKTSAGQHTISQGGLEKLRLIVPPINLQNKFASIITQIEKQKAQTQLELNRAEELYQSLLQRAFTGELFPEKELPEAL